MQKLAGILLGCLVSGCVTQDGQPPAMAAAAATPPVLATKTPVTLTPVDTAAVKQGVTKALKDPESARFGAMKAGADGKGVVSVCGYVNAKNSFGGYTGEKLFTGVVIGEGQKKGFVMIGMGGKDTDTIATHSVCSEMGLIP